MWFLEGHTVSGWLTRARGFPEGPFPTIPQDPSPEGAYQTLAAEARLQKGSVWPATNSN